jgi:O-antigen ligase
METIFATKTDYNYATEYGRIAIAKRGVGYMLRYPAFGVGIANFPRAEGTISPIAESRIRRGMSVEWIAPHNTYVQVGAELGMPALGLWFGMLGAGTVGLLLLRRKTPASWDQESGERRFLRDMLLFLPMSYLAFAVTSFFLSHGYSSPVHILLAYTAGVVALTRRELAASPLPRRGGAPAPSSTRRGWRPSGRSKSA